MGVCRISILKIHWMFPNTAAEVAKFVASCPICALNKKSQHVQRPPYSLSDHCVAPGDIDQIDNTYVDSVSNGLTYAIEKFKEYPIAAHITLLKGERSELASLGAKIL